MRLRKIDRYLLLLAALFLLAVLRRTDLPGEEMLPHLYQTAIHRPLLAQAAAAVNDDELDRVKLRSELESARYRIRQLENQLEAAHELGGYFRELHWEASPEAIPGWVTTVDPNPFRRAFSIDLGTRDGVRAGMPVVTGRALLGVVRIAEGSVSSVLRVDDPATTLEVEIQAEGSSVPGVARGDGEGGLRVRFVRRAGALRKGDTVFTTRYHPAIPPGLVVGWVEEVADLDRDGVQEVEVTPAAALGRWAQISVVRRRR